MLCCFNPSCHETQNQEDQAFCVSCGSPLLLKERYHAVKLLGSGGFGRTFQGIDTNNLVSTTKHCAIKQLYIPNMVGEAKQKVLELFERESQWLYQLEEHPQTPKFIDYFTADNNLYLVQELVIGKTLGEELKERQTPYQEEEIIAFLKEIIAILKYIHQYKIIHRDLKPDNLIRRDTDQKWVLIDFGASRILSETALVGGATIIGTPEYMAPEQHRGKVLPASDLYSLGIICVQMITGQSTLEMFDLQTNQWDWQRHIPSNLQVSQSFVKLIDKLIAPSLGDRLQSALQVEQSLKRLQQRKNSQGLQPHQPSESTFIRQAKYLHPTQQATVPLYPNSEPPTEFSIPQIPSPNPEISTQNSTQTQYDFKALTQHLRWHRWDAADTETWDLISQAIAKSSRQFLFVQDIPLIPCDLLWELDQLWLKYSKNRFGFSKQLEIYQAVNGDYPQFCVQLGWSLQGNGKRDQEFQFKTQAPIGHLPSRQKMGGSALWKNTQAFYERLMDCGF